MRKRSLTRQLIVSVVLTQLVLTAAVVALATYLTVRQLRASFDAELHGRAMAISALVRYSEDEKPKLIFDATMVPPPLDARSTDEYEIVGSDGHMIARSAWWAAFQPVKGEGRGSWDVRVDERPYRVIRLKNVPVLDEEAPGATSPERLTVYYAASSAGIRERAARVALVILLGSLALLVVAIAAAVWAVRRGLEPLEKLAASAGQVTAQNWKLNAPEEAHATLELAPLTAAMDRMLATLQSAFTSQRDFVANAAHELKTPIAVLKSTLQLALQRPRTAEEYRARLQEALDDVARLESLAHSLLRLARAEQLQGRDRQELPAVDVAASCEQSAERW
ncbi:MAG: histidine kinase dimerization/phospho-acceptor domain-containing protein, partial [Terriglobales bacterium]